ncbi:amidohydrolase [Acuticoccus sediminis]|uniref:Amidohydrolase n=1 Tax=Acuticoccus sediminis TaxID=2184697 RepID=A0A8B2NQ99_9HYPH|nr:amidohydrolase [Acuticoccus sediminis]RAI02056.1 amidohydrolase [Acuticoccus sediminis]
MLPRADVVLKNGRIWCGLAEGACSAIALWGGRVLATGDGDELDALIGPETRVVDLDGRLATPGLNDAHLHLLPYGRAMAEVDLRPKAAPTLDALIDALKARAAVTPPGEWIRGRGYDHFEFAEKRHPFREELDAAVPDHPVYIVRTCGHLAVANSMALERAGIGEGTPSPAGGLIERQNGRLTGLLAETARELVMHALPTPTEADLVAAIERGGNDLLTYGITSCMEAAVGIESGWLEMLAYQTARRSGRLPVRTYAVLMGDRNRTILDRAYEAGYVTGSGDDMLRIGGVKIFTDGSAGGRTAAMSRPYLGGGDNDLGILCLPDAELDAMVLAAHRRGYRMTIHAIGDAAIGQTLTALEKALDDTPDPDRRHRIEHCGWLTDEQMERLAARHILPAPQPAFIYYFGDLYLDVLGMERSAASHPMRTWIEKGLEPSASTDCPVTAVNPFPNLYTMVTRRTNRGTQIGPEHKLSLAEALHAYTYASAYAAKEEAIKGRLVPGQLADVAVFSRDMFEGEPEAILDTVCDMTIRGGEVVYERGAAAA